MESLELKKIDGEYYLYGNYEYISPDDFERKYKSKRLGKVDRNTGAIHFNPSFLAFVEEQGILIDNALNSLAEDYKREIEINVSASVHKYQNIKYAMYKFSDEPVPEKVMTFDASKIRFDECKRIGATHLLKYLSDSLGLTKILQKVFPRHWSEILSLSFFESIENGGLYRFDYFCDSYNVLRVPEGTDEDIVVDILANITEEKMASFFKKWSELQENTNCLAYNVILRPIKRTLSSFLFSYQTSMFEPGYALIPRDNLKVSVFFGDNSPVPVYAEEYDQKRGGGISSFKRSAETFRINSRADLGYVLDSDDYSRKTVGSLLDSSKKFMIELPRTESIKSDLIEKYKHIYGDKKYLLGNYRYDVYGTTARIKWGDRGHITAHIIADPNLLIDYLDFPDQEMFGPFDIDYTPDFSNTRLFYSRHREKTCSQSEYVAHLMAKNNLDLAELSGWYVCLSNFVNTAEEASKIFRRYSVIKEVYEFLPERENLNLTPYRYDDIYSGKNFIHFITLILASKIHSVMSDSDLYMVFTRNMLLRNLNQISRTKYGYYVIHTLMDGNQKKIFDTFGCPYPRNFYGV